MKQKIKKSLIAIAGLLVSLNATAYDFKVDGIYYGNSGNNTVYVTYSNDDKYSGYVYIPSSVWYNGKTYSVTWIGNYAFEGCDNLTYVDIPYSVTYIGSEAFSGCTGLTSIEIPSSLTFISSDAFLGCTGLTDVYIYDLSAWCKIVFGNYYSNPLYYAKKLNLNGEEIKDLVIPDDITEINSYTFRYCTGLTSITIPNSVTWISGGAFYGCTGLTSIIVENGNSEYDSRENCNAIIETASNTLIKGCENSTIPNSITSIRDYAFSGCNGLTSVTIPNSVTSIGCNAFYNTGWYNNQPDGILYLDNCCLGYKGNKPTGMLSLNENTRIIGSSAFEACTGLTSITIPNSVTSIGYDAFDYCRGLTEVNITDLSAWCKIDFINNSSSNPLSYAKKLKLNGKEIKDLVIPNDINEIKRYAFYGCSGLTSITIPNSVTSIGRDAFYNTGWYNNQPDGILYLDNCCLGYKGNKPTGILSLKENTRLIGNGAFEYCTGLTSLTIPNSVTSIGSEAFYNCSGLISITIPNSITEIGMQAFDGCDYLNKIVSLNPTPPTCNGSDSFCSDNYSEATLYVPKDSFAKYFVDDVWGLFSNIKKIETLVSSITLNETTLTINPGNDFTLKATIYPSNATIPNLTWESNNSTIATVDQNGKITIISAGTATITVRANDGSNVFATCKVTVNSVTPTITLSQTEVTLPVNDVMTLNYTITNSATKTATWSTSDASVAYIKTNSDGSATIVGKADGMATITATLVDNGKEYYASCIVKIIGASISLSHTDVTLPVNDIMTLSYNIVNYVTNNTTATWSTSDSSVAYIKTNNNGSATIVGMADGVATISATMVDNGKEYSASCKVTVGVGGVESVEVDNNATEVARYDIYGHRLNKPTKGINIVKYSNGSTRKECVK